MGDRAIITTREKTLAVYMHWRGGRDTVEPLLHYCKLKGYRAPTEDCYGWARLCQVIGNYLGGTLSVGIDSYDRAPWADDNGEYIIDGWRIADRVLPFNGYVEAQKLDFGNVLMSINRSMPYCEWLNEDYLLSEEVAVSSLRIGDEVWLVDSFGECGHYSGAGFGDRELAHVDVSGRPYLAAYGKDGFDSYLPNYLLRETCQIKERANGSSHG